MKNEDYAALIKEVEEIHQRIDQQTAPLAQINQERLNCKQGCAVCCVDELTVFEVEADLIKTKYSKFLKTEKAGPANACAFLDQNKNCRIYDHRPYVCRTQGLPLRWLDFADEDEETLFELRDICPENEEGVPVEELAADVCWTLGPIEEKLATLQSRADNGQMKRISLRGLFEQA